MPVKTGIHLRIRWTRKNLDSGLRRNDGLNIDSSGYILLHE